MLRSYKSFSDLNWYRYYVIDSFVAVWINHNSFFITKMMNNGINIRIFWYSFVVVVFKINQFLKPWVHIAYFRVFLLILKRWKLEVWWSSQSFYKDITSKIHLDWLLQFSFSSPFPIISFDWLYILKTFSKVKISLLLFFLTVC